MLPTSAVPRMQWAISDELSEAVFSSLPRADQRTKAEAYAKGILKVSGRKSVRNIAAHLDRGLTEQGLHHFVSSSTWDWRPVRLALARYLVHDQRPKAWVVRSLVIPKSGAKSVGVGTVFCPDREQSVNAQHAVGVWAAAQAARVPVWWHLHLPRPWLDDGRCRKRAMIPEGTRHMSLGDGALESYLEFASQPGLPALPAVFDIADLDPCSAVQRLQTAKLPFCMKVGGDLPLTVVDEALAGHTSAVLAAHHVASAARARRRPVRWVNSATGAPGMSLVTGTRVTMPQTDGHRQLWLVAVNDVHADGPPQLWLTDLPGCEAGAVARLCEFSSWIEHETPSIADKVGLRDFSGRSFPGWHRHLTLASVASAAAMAEPLEAEARPVPLKQPDTRVSLCRSDYGRALL